MLCQEFLDLKKSYDVADQRRINAVWDLIEFAGRVEHTTFEKLKREVKDTSDTCQAAWDSLEAHRKSHRCETAERESAIPARISLQRDESSLRRGRLR